jgi:hypothetical protein
MNAVETKIVGEFDSLSQKIVGLTSDLDAQIKYLTSLRDSFQALMVMLAPLAAKMRAGTSGFVPQPEPATETFEKLASVARERASAFALVGTVPESLEAAITSPSRPAASPKREPQWKMIQRLMAGREKFTMTEAGLAVEAETGVALGANRPQIVRNNLVRHDMDHDKIFRRNADATWTVMINPEVDA